MSKYRNIFIVTLIFLISFFSINYFLAKQSLQKSTQHFNFYSEDSISVDRINDIAVAMENNYDRVTNDIGYQMDSKLDVYVYSSPKDLQKALNSHYAWLKDSYRNDKLYLSLHKDVLKSSVHEFTHAVIHRDINRTTSLPRWLNEGLAQYEANQQPAEDFKPILFENIYNNSVPNLFLSGNDDSKAFAEQYGYQYSYLATKFLVEEYGKENMQDLIKSYNDFDKIYNMSSEQCYVEWIKYLKRNESGDGSLTHADSNR